jgi:hypothetical protein
VISSLFLFFLSYQSFASEDLETFCFKAPSNLGEVRDSISFLLLPKEKVFLRQEAHCVDILTSTDRVKLLEKFLSKRYTLIKEVPLGEKAETNLSLNDFHCQLELTTTRTKKAIESELAAGNMNRLRARENTEKQVEVSQILLSLGKPGTLDLDKKSLLVECRKGSTGVYQLIFSFSEVDRARVSSEISVKQNEVVSIAQIASDLNEKNKTLGIPQTILEEIQSRENIEYQLKVK